MRHSQETIARIIYKMKTARGRRNRSIITDTKTIIQDCPRLEAKTYIESDKDKEGFEVRFIDKYIGKGVFATKHFKKGDFLMCYVGELVSNEEIQQRERKYPLRLGSFLYFITWRGKRYGVDATFSDRICRFVNDGVGRERNSIMILETFNDHPYLCLYASRNIAAGKEIRYDYGVNNLPWRRKNKSQSRTDSSKNQFDERGTSTNQKVVPCSVVIEELTLSSIQKMGYDTIPLLSSVDIPGESSKPIPNVSGNLLDDHNVQGNITETQSDNESVRSSVDENLDGITALTAQSIDHSANGYTTKLTKNLQTQFPKHRQPKISDDKCDATTTTSTTEQPTQSVDDNPAENTSITTKRPTQSVDDNPTENTSMTTKRPTQSVGDSNAGDTSTSTENRQFQLVDNIRNEESSISTKDTNYNDRTTQSIEDSPNENTFLTENHPTQNVDKKAVGNIKTSSEKHQGQDTQLNGKSSNRHGNKKDTKTKVTTETSQSKCKKKPYRPCMYCLKPQSKLLEHLKRKHKDEDRVKAALALPNALRNKEFDKIRKDGIFAANRKILLDKEITLEKKKTILLKERRQGEKDISICSLCNGFFAIHTVHKHKRNCPGAEASAEPPVGLPISCINDAADATDFRDKILRKFRRDNIGEICRTDTFIKLLGHHNFRKVKTRAEKGDELTDSIMRDMRRFAALYKEFKSLAEKDRTQITSGADVLKREHFRYLQEAVINLTAKDDGTIKSGLKTGLGYLLKRAIKVLKGHYLLEQEDEKANEVDKFSTLLSYFWISMFSDAEYANVKARQSHLRRPKHLPLEEDIKSLRSYMIAEITKYLDPHCFFTQTEYKCLRDIMVCRLTLFNARRGGEPSRLLLREWKDAEKGEWISESAVQSINDPLEKQLIGKFKIAFQSGKNLNQMVPLLIPNDCLEGLKKLADEELRTAAGVNPCNPFLFPNTMNSEKHIKGWHAVDSVCTRASISKTITATSMRHRASTIYAGLDIPEGERQLFYQHMGHSEQMNKNVYQCPLAVQEVTKVGKFLSNLDANGMNATAGPANADSSPNVVAPDNIAGSDSRDSDDDETQNKGDSEKDVRSLLHTWTARDTDTVRTFFSSWIDDNSTRDKNMSLPGNTDINGFLRRHPDILKKFSPKKKLLLIRAKLRKEKNKSRNQVPEDIDPSDNENDPDYQQPSSDTDSDNTERKTMSSKLKPKVQRHVWTSDETQKVRTHFSSWIDDTSALDRKGSSTGENDINTFLKKYPEILKNHSQKKKKLLIRAKIYNERNKSRNLMTDIRHSDTENTDNGENEIQKKDKHRKKKPKKDPRHIWGSKETHKVRTHFSSWIDDTSSFDRKGPLPGKKEIDAFLKVNPEVLHQFSKEKRVSLMRTKLFNERNKSRSRVNESLKGMWK
ncbi:uncharacterized protein [Argopecten irradians]|uniref:uncharacterized protein isoform X2 n=1 Tax=Argopecten irradians TaxID=31199 RepID=UPI00371F2FE6